MEKNILPVIGISIGDVNGIGPEVIIKTFSDARMLDYCIPVIYGSSAALNYHKKLMDARNFNFFMIRKVHEAKAEKVNVLNCGLENIRINVGQQSSETGTLAYQSLTAMIDDAKDGKLDAIVTAPIDKFSIQSAQFDFKGHTEYLAAAANTDVLMIMTSDELKVALVTGHMPLSEVSSSISIEKIQLKLRLFDESLRRDFLVPKPRIAVLGLNPHAGDNGLLGLEEKNIITPAIEVARRNDILAFGPFPADGFFGTHHFESFDGVLAMYHDQGLAPFKLMNFVKGVNYTAGLPIVRTSPDHGTAYSLAGKNLANDQSFREAIYTAIDIMKNRRLFGEMNARPLQTQVAKEKEA